MLKIYEINGTTYQYHEGEQPKDAKLVGDAKRVERKEAPAMQNKARTPRTKSVMRDGR